MIQIRRWQSRFRSLFPQFVILNITDFAKKNESPETRQLPNDDDKWKNENLIRKWYIVTSREGRKEEQFLHDIKNCAKN